MNYPLPAPAPKNFPLAAVNSSSSLANPAIANPAITNKAIAHLPVANFPVAANSSLANAPMASASVASTSVANASGASASGASALNATVPAGSIASSPMTTSAWGESSPSSRRKPVDEQTIALAIASVIEDAQAQGRSLEQVTAEILADDVFLSPHQRQWLSQIVVDAWTRLVGVS